MSMLSEGGVGSLFEGSCAKSFVEGDGGAGWEGLQWEAERCTTPSLYFLTAFPSATGL